MWISAPNILYHILLNMSSGSISHSSSSTSTSSSDISENTRLDLVLVPAKSYQPCSNRRQVVSAPAALESTPKLKQSSLLASTKPVHKEGSETKSTSLSKTGLDWSFEHVYATRSGHGKATLGTASGAPKGCELMWKPYWRRNQNVWMGANRLVPDRHCFAYDDF